MLLHRTLQIAAAIAISATPLLAQEQELDVKVNEMYTKTYVEALPSLLEASAKLREALGHKEDAAKLRAAIADLTKGGTKPNADLATSLIVVQSDASKSISADLTAKTAVSPEQMQAFIDGASAYLDGAFTTVQIAKLVPGLSKAIGEFQMPKNPMAVKKAMGTVAAGKAMADNIPNLTQGNVDTAKALKAYIIANKIKIPTEKLSLDFGK